MIPTQLNDGYTVSLHGCLVRPMLGQVSRELFELVRDGQEMRAIERVFASPNLVHGEPESLPQWQQQDLWEAIVTNPSEKEDLQNLLSGAKLRVTNPAAASYSCSTCKTWITDYETWMPSVRPGGITLKRRPGGELLCDTQQGCPRGTWQEPLALSKKNTKAWNHFWEYRLAGMPLPDCPIQRRNWKLLSWVCDYEASSKFRPTICPTA